jgi:tRNA(fMet)-specific endonuclease VapC
MIYLLDTDTLIFVVRGLKGSGPKNEREKQRLQIARRIVAKCQKRQAAGDEVGLSAITVAELEFGARNSGDYDREISAVRKVLSPFVVYDFDATHAAEHYGETREALERIGAPIGAMDLLIAGHAKALGATLVTNNTAHFSRVTGLACENWSA